MPNYQSSANIVLSVNGKQAKQMLNSLEKDAKRLQQQLDKATLKGDTAGAKRLQKELTTTNRLIEQMKGSAASVDNVLRRLDSATPKELNKALRTLQQQLNGIQRGTAAWDAHVAKIKALKAELQRVNATMATQQSWWTRFNNWLNGAQTAIMALAAAVTGLVMAGRKAVQSYADMEEQMANTIKYTRMTAEEVAELNEAFKKMDTRLAREQLNLLAQEGGRLGYNTVASVKEYVEAASIINVALVDLGEGATQTIAKLSNIFGMEQMYGVREAMLKIGSTVNHLSQNCTAAKPYIVEFAQRMAGIGSTAKMTIPEIMAFAATLDAHGQKVEMSATALQRTIMELFKRPAEMARKVGLEANAFIETLNKSTTNGVIMFLDALHKLGEDQALAVLSPLFQDLGLDGARVSSVLSNLSSHLDFLKWQLGEAAGAFRDGTSASNEYAIFNNTVQASIDKARKRVGELAIELGEKLYPVMKHIYTSSGIFMRVLNQIVSFFIQYRKEILTLTAALTAYNVVLLLYNARTVLATKLTALFHGGLKLLHGIVPVLKLMVAALTNTVQYFTNGLEVNYAMQQRWRASMEAMKFTSWVGLVMALAAAVYYLSTKTNEYQKKLREAVNHAGEFAEALIKEQRELDELFGKLEGARKGTKEFDDTRDEIMKKYGKYLEGLVNEQNEIVDLEKAYIRLAAAVRLAAKERAISTAREMSENAYKGQMSTLSEQLPGALERFGYEPRDAARLSNKIIVELTYDGSISAESRDELARLPYNYQDSFGWTGHPINIVNDMSQAAIQFKAASEELDELASNLNPLAGQSADDLEQTIFGLQQALNGNTSANIYNRRRGELVEIPAADVADLLHEAEAMLSAKRTVSPEVVGGNPDFNLDEFTPFETEKERKARLVKARKEFKEAINAAKGDWEAGSAQNTSDYSASLKSWTEYLEEKHRLEMQYFADRMAVFERYNLQEDEDYQELLKKKAEAEAAWLKRKAALTVDDARRRQKADEVQAQMDFATPTSSIYQNEEALQQRLFEIKIEYLQQMQAAYAETSEEYHNYAVQIEQAQDAERLRRQQLLSKRIQEWRKKYEYQHAGERLNLELDLLNEAHDKMLISDEEYYRARRDITRKYAEDYLPNSAKPQSGSAESMEKAKARDLQVVADLEAQGVLTHEQAEKAKERISNTYDKKQLERVRRFGSTQTNQLLDIYEAWKNFFDATEEDGGNWATRLAALASSVFAVMSAGMQQASEFIQAEADIEVAKTEKKYDREIEMAEGNSYRVRKAEKAKEQEIAKIKSEASRKQYQMKVIEAVAQTATNALNAYGSAAAVPVIGYILAPIAAAMAVAAGAIQIATIKKQQQASEAQGYAEGGFTPPGRRDEAVGVVHAGEWVASQKLVNNPRTRPLLEALDYAQRTNTIGSLRMDDVSRAVTAPIRLAEQQPAAQQPVTNIYNTLPADNSDLVATIAELRQRLSEPFFTVNTVSGDLGYEKAKAEYEKLIRNKTPKSKR